MGGPILRFSFELGSACSSLISIFVFLHIYTNVVASWASPMFLGTTSLKIFWFLFSQLLDIALLRRKGVCKTAWVACLLLGFFSLFPYFFPFEVLLQISQIFHQISILLDYASIISLRHEFPDMERPYKIPLGTLVYFTLSSRVSVFSRIEFQNFLILILTGSMLLYFPGCSDIIYSNCI